MVWGAELFARPGRDLLLLGEQDDLPVCGDLQEKVEDVMGSGEIGMDCRVVEDERARLVMPCQVVSERDS